MANMIERDPAAMERFAGEIETYSGNIRRVCNALLSDMDQARSFMKDDPTKRALQKIEAFANNLKASLPPAEEAAEKLHKSAKLLTQALGITV
ncbi:hypothetical protein FACS1894200_00390 [Spirochaetia bacterium]|nr:hypothetical protein FACS1894200_00390 [Spirochaetia bacterium]